MSKVSPCFDHSISHNHKTEFLAAMDIYRLNQLRVLRLHFQSNRDFLFQLSDVIHSLPLDGPLEEINIQVDVGAYKIFP